MEEKNKKVKETKWRKVTAEEWKRIGLPTSSMTIHFGPPPSWVRKLKELNKK